MVEFYKKGWWPQAGDYYWWQVPTAPQNVAVTLLDSSTANVTWEPPIQDSNIPPAMGYYVYKERFVNGEPLLDSLRKAIAIADESKLHAVIRDLEPNSEYAFHVAAFNKYGDGEHAVSKRIVTGGRPPSPPRPQSVSLLSEDHPLQARVKWLPPQLTFGKPITRYLIWYKPAESPTHHTIEVAPTVEEVVLDGLVAGQEYEILVAAENEFGMSGNATERLVTPIGVPDSEPLNIRYVIRQKLVSIHWDPPAWEHRNGNISYYHTVLTSMDSEGSKTERNVTSPTTTYEINPKLEYAFRVTAATIRGEGPFSPVLSIVPSMDATTKDP